MRRRKRWKMKIELCTSRVSFSPHLSQSERKRMKERGEYSILSILFIFLFFTIIKSDSPNPEPHYAIFNSTLAEECAEIGGCDYYNATIWVDGYVPGSNDYAYINGGSITTTIIISNQTTLQRLIMQNVDLKVNNVTINVDIFIATTNSSVTATGNTEIIINLSGDFLDSTIVSLYDTTKFSVAEYLEDDKSRFFVDDTSEFLAYQTSNVWMYHLIILFIIYYLLLLYLFLFLHYCFYIILFGYYIIFILFGFYIVDIYIII